MLGGYDENKVFSSIDEQGRYAFGNQGKIAQWNMARLADCLMPLLIKNADNKLSKEEREQQTLTKVETLIHQYTDKFDIAYFTMYGKKLGLKNITVNNKSLISDLLALMQSQSLDYTQTFLKLAQSLSEDVKAQELKHKLGDWYEKWLIVLEEQEPKKGGYQQAEILMRKNNPVVIPRNHHIETLLGSCENIMATDLSSLDDSKEVVINTIVDDFLQVLRSPYKEIEKTHKYQDIPSDSDMYYQTFCGT
jgi:uncharacterized protein YdiU (UPF0061 family)